MANIKCECGGKMIMVEYGLMDKYHYDGISEERCLKCGNRYGRWCGQLLGPDEVEPQHHDGERPHPRVMTL